MLHGASDNKALIVSGCTSVHPYKYDDIFKFCNIPSPIAQPGSPLARTPRLNKNLKLMRNYWILTGWVSSPWTLSRLRTATAYEPSSKAVYVFFEVTSTSLAS